MNDREKSALTRRLMPMPRAIRLTGGEAFRLENGCRVVLRGAADPERIAGRFRAFWGIVPKFASEAPTGELPAGEAYRVRITADELSIAVPVRKKGKTVDRTVGHGPVSRGTIGIILSCAGADLVAVRPEADMRSFREGRAVIHLHALDEHVRVAVVRRRHRLRVCDNRAVFIRVPFDRRGKSAVGRAFPAVVDGGVRRAGQRGKARKEG